MNKSRKKELSSRKDHLEERCPTPNRVIHADAYLLEMHELRAAA